MIKVLTRFGLLMMNPEERESKLNEVIKGNTIRAGSLAKLIDECMDNCYHLTERETPNITDQQNTQIRWMLQGIEGEKVVKSMMPEEILDWVLDLKKGKFTNEELLTVAKSIMMRE